ncbi:hypothetical protein [Pseudaestuariivita rosea]|uniref:hypothetical protein n=1 Tax=Pseudaestuariivita rosea TaxID=2763263 RepID=UPI001ABA6C3C|nr:hypothetical protein [Pseudaestuariivita rosea]
MRRICFISLLAVLAPLSALACSPGYVENPGPIEHGDLCSYVEPQHIGENFGEPALDLGEGRVAQIIGYGNGCDLDSSIILTQCTSSQQVQIGPDLTQAVPNGGGFLYDIKSAIAPNGALELRDPLPELAASAARRGHDITWLEPLSNPYKARSTGPADLSCACRTFYPDTPGAQKR